MRVAGVAGWMGTTPERWLTRAVSDATGITSSPGTSAASRASSAGTSTRSKDSLRASAAIGNTPRTWRTDPSSDNSPSASVPSSHSGRICPVAARAPSAMGKS